MSDTSNTVRLHRVLRAPAERVYQAFLDPDALCRWLPPYGFLGKIDPIDPQVGGSYPSLAADMTKTITLRSVSCGTGMEILHEGLPPAIPAAMCYLGWQESLVQLANLAEPNIPDGE